MLHRRDSRRRARRFGLALCAATTALGALSAPGQAATISGTVANDYNADGVRNTAVGPGAAIDAGLGGVTVTAYAASGAQLATTTSSTIAASLGQYTLAVPDGTAPTPVRVEFTNLPATYAPGPFGTNDGTSVQFVTVPAGAAASVTNVDFGAAVPEDFCQSNPLLITCRASFGPSGFDGGNEAVVGYRPNFGSATDINDASAGKVILATKEQVGSAFGEAVNPANGDVFVAAYNKGHTGFGPGGIGAIYRIPAQGTTGAYGTPATFATISNVGVDEHPSTDPNDFTADKASFPTIGRRGLGDIETSPDGTGLYAVNEAQNTLVPVPFASGNPGAPVTITNPCAAQAEFHAMGLGKRRGLLYVGGVCTNEAGNFVTAVVQSYSPTTGAFATVLTTQNLTTFDRKCGDRAGNASETDGTNTKADNCPNPNTAWQANWHPWSDDVTRPSTLRTSIPSAQPNLDVVGYAQPMVSTISFIGDDLVLGLRDRWGDQLGKSAGGPAPSDTFCVQQGTPCLTGVGLGDVYRACRAGGVGTYTLESNGTCGTLTATGGVGNAEGPGGGEFFFGDDALRHDQTFMGASAGIPGYRDVQTTAFDPIFALFEQGGVVWNNTTTGTRSTQLRVYQDTRGAFGKANGLGDLEAICTSAPLQIGNRVFRDNDRDGIQDANEPGIAGVTVQLLSGSTVVATTTTGNGTTAPLGQYLFGNVAGNPLVLSPNTAYTVRILTTQAPLAGLQASPTATGLVRTIDSNGAVVSTADTAGITTGAAGQNDHTVDFGFFQPRYDLALRKTVAEDVVAIGQVVPFTITVFNQSPDSGSVAQDIRLVDQIPDGLELADPDWTAGPGNTATRTIPGPLAVGDSTAVTIRLRVLSSATGRLVNRSEITRFSDTAGQTQPTITDIDSTPDANVLNDVEIDDVIDNTGGDEDDEDLAAIRVVRYDLAIRKTTPLDIVSPGDKVPFSIEVFNQGPDAEAVARNITVTDTPPDGLSFVAADNPDWSDAGNGQIQRTIPGPLAPGASTVISIVLTVNATAPDGPLRNLAEISSFQDFTATLNPPDIDSTPDTNPTNDTEVDDVIDNSGGDEDDADPAVVRLVRYDLAIRKTTPRTTVKVGDLVPFDIEVFNQAADPLASASSIAVIDEIPTGFSFNAADNPGWTSAGGRKVQTTIPGPLAPGTSTRIAIKLRVAPGAKATTLINATEIAAFDGTIDGKPKPDIDSTPDTDVTNDKLVDDVIDNAGGDEDDEDIAGVRLLVDDRPPVIAVSKVFTPTSDCRCKGASKTAKKARVGGIAHWRVTVRNTGPIAAKNVVVCDVLPSNLSYVSASVKVTFRNGRPCFKLGTLAAGKSKSFVVRTKVLSRLSGTATNRVIATADDAATKRARATVAICKPPPGPPSKVTG